jgi:peptidyl-prolyl cis-trans isomerase C
MIPHSKLLFVLFATSSLLLGACSQKKPTTTGDAAPVAIKINGEPVSVAELNVRLGHADSGKNYAIGEPLMKTVVNMELLQQAAVQSKLDADPLIKARIANSTRMILATSYLDKQLAAVGEPTESEISTYFNQHPERFAKRMQFDLQEFSIQLPPGKEADIRAQAAKSRKFDELEQWLTKNHISHTNNPSTKLAEQIPEEMLKKLMDVPVGGSVVMGDKGQMNVIFLLGKSAQPLTLAQASRMIAVELAGKRKRDIIDNTLKQLSDKAKIEYVPPYTASGYSPPVKQE